MIKIQFATELECCQHLWEKFSPHKTLWDEWQINEYLYNAERDQLKFMYTDRSLLPIVYNQQKDRHELMGNGYAENRTVWIDDSEIELFFNQLPENTKLFDMNGASVENILDKHDIHGFEQDCSRYFMGVPAQQFLQQASGNLRRNINKALRDTADITFTVETDRLDVCIEFNKARFCNESDFNEPEYIAAWQKITTLPYIPIANENAKKELHSDRRYDPIGRCQDNY